MTKAVTALFVTARMRSSRLPNKMLSDIEGKPALGFLLDRMKGASHIDAFVVCTSTSESDAQIERLASDHGWLCSRGDEEDVLLRYLQAADQHRIDFFINVDGDDLFCSVGHVGQVVERYLRTGADYVYCDGLPFGGAPTGVRVEALREVCSKKGEAQTQGWGKYFMRSGLFGVEKIEAEDHLRRPAYRMSLDYPEDLEFFRRTVREMDPRHERSLSLEEVVAFLDAHPEIAAISQQVNEQYWERFQREHGSFSMKGDEGR